MIFSNEIVVVFLGINVSDFITSACKVFQIIFSYWPLFVFILVVFILYYNNKSKDFISKMINKLVGSGIPSTYVAIVTLVFGAMFSVFSSELKNEIEDGVGITVILSLIGLSFLFLMLKQNDEIMNANIKSKEEKLDKQINNLKIHLSNMPPKAVLHNISQHVIALNELVMQNKLPTENKVKEILSSIVKLAVLWDGHDDTDDVDYNINFMLLLSSQSVKDAIYQGSSDFKDAIIKSPFFLYADNLDSRLDNCDAILYTKREYSKSTGSQHSFDESRPCMCLPVSIDEKKAKDMQPNIFGAPASVVRKKASYIPNTSDALQNFIKDAESSHSRFSKQYMESLNQYYGDCKYSIYSIPLLNKNDEIFAVVNIYQSFIGSDNKLILRSEEHASSFYHLMAPICNLLAQVLDLEAEVETKTNNQIDESKEG